jgi:hypothetical protein
MDSNVSQNSFSILAFKIAGADTALVLVGFVATRRCNRSAERGGKPRRPNSKKLLGHGIWAQIGSDDRNFTIRIHDHDNERRDARISASGALPQRKRSDLILRLERLSATVENISVSAVILGNSNSLIRLWPDDRSPAPWAGAQSTRRGEDGVRRQLVTTTSQPQLAPLRGSMQFLSGGRARHGFARRQAGLPPAIPTVLRSAWLNGAVAHSPSERPVVAAGWQMGAGTNPPARLVPNSCGQQRGKLSHSRRKLS